MTDPELEAATALLAEQFRDMEEREWGMYPSKAFRDVELVQWVIRCLANPRNEYGDLLDVVWERRNRAGVRT